jgi:hypothetical protein
MTAKVKWMWKYQRQQCKLSRLARIIWSEKNVG